MNRAEKRRQQKQAKKKALQKKPVSPPPSTGPQPMSVDQAINLALQHQSAGDLEKAQSIYQQILKAVPNQPAALHFLGVLAHQVGESNIAVDFISKALAVKPDYAEAHSNLGSALQALERFEEAAVSYRKALSLNSSFVDAQYNLGVSLKELGQLDEAMECYSKTLLLNPRHAQAYNNLGLILADLNREDEAFEYYRKSIAADPDYPEAHNNLSRYYLQRYDFKQGWAEYDWGLKIPNARAQDHNFPCPMWQGESLQGKNIFIYAEQGIGDEVLFASCLSDLIVQSPSRVFLECELRLGPLFARSFPEVEVYGKARDQDHSWIGQGVELDYYTPIGSLPKYLRNHPDDFPKRDRFLIPEKQLQASIRAHYQQQWPEKRLVGIAWKSVDKGSGSQRSLELEQLLPVLSCAECQFINLQYGDVEGDLAALKAETGMDVYFDSNIDPLTDLDSFAAQIAALDLVISIDNSTVHFSGAVGTPTWILLPFNTNWRWPLVGNDTLWYSSVSLYRQHKFNEWDGVVTQVANELRQKIVTMPEN